MSTTIYIAFTTAFFLGLLIGAERERVQQLKHFEDFAGIRSFIFISILGCTSAYIHFTWFNWFLAVSYGTFFLLILATYLYNSFKKGHEGITTELSALLTFLIGFLCWYQTELAVILGVSVTLLLTLKDFSHQLLQHIKDVEFYATIKFAIIAFIILPFLPDTPIDPWQIFNPYRIWLFVVFVCGVSFMGYILNKVVGLEKGSRYTGLFGGITSSTAVTAAFSTESHLVAQGRENIIPLVSGILLSIEISLVRIMVFIFLINQDFFYRVFVPVSTVFVILMACSFAVRFFTPAKHHVLSKFELESPFRLKTAIEFGIILTVILMVAEFGRIYFGDVGIYITSLFSGMAKGEAIAITVSTLALKGDITYTVAVKALMLSMTTGLLTKYFIARWSGTKQFERLFGEALIGPVLISLLFFLFYGTT